MRPNKNKAFSKKIQNYKTQILIKYFIKKAGNDNINLESEIDKLITRLAGVRNDS